MAIKTIETKKELAERLALFIRARDWNGTGTFLQTADFVPWHVYFFVNAKTSGEQEHFIKERAIYWLFPCRQQWGLQHSENNLSEALFQYAMSHPGLSPGW